MSFLYIHLQNTVVIERDNRIDIHAIIRLRNYFKAISNNPFSTFPYIPRKTPFREKSFITKSLEINSKDSDFHSTFPFITNKNWEASKLHY